MSVTSINKQRYMKGGVNGRPVAVISESNTPPVVVAHRFPTQSYFDYRGQALGAQALIANPPNTEIIDVQKRDDIGYSIGLAPWSQAPVTVRFKIGGQQSSSTPLTIKPGQILRPQGKMGEKVAQFNGFEFGLPYNWLGGGIVTLYVFPSAQAELQWDSSLNEVLFHCQQVQVRESSLTPPALLRNWPTRFPWEECFRYNAANNVALQQNGQAVLAITQTTRVILRLRGNVALPAPEAARACLWGTDDFEHGADGLVVNTAQGFFEDFSFPGNQVTAGMAANDPAVNLPADVFGLGGAEAGITIDVPTGSPLLTSGPDGGPCLVDICRYGRLG